MLEKIDQLVRQVKGQTSYVHDSSNHMLDLSGQLNSNALTQFESVQQAFDYFQNVRQRMEQELEADQALIATMQSSFDKVTSMGKGIELTRGQMNEMADFIKEVEQRLEQVTDSKESADHIRMMLDDTSSTIASGHTNIGHFVEAFNQLTDGLTYIPHQIKLLAGEMESIYHGMDEFLDNLEHVRLNTETMQGNRQRQRKEFDHVLERMNQVLVQIEENQKFSLQMNSKVNELRSQSGFLEQIVKQFKTKKEAYH